MKQHISLLQFSWLYSIHARGALIDRVKMDDPGNRVVSSDQSANLKKKGTKTNIEKDAPKNCNYKKVLEQ